MSVCVCVCMFGLKDSSALSQTELGKSKIIVSGGFTSKGKCHRTVRIKLKFDIIFLPSAKHSTKLIRYSWHFYNFLSLHFILKYGSDEEHISYEKLKWIKSVMRRSNFAYTIVAYRDSSVIHRALCKWKFPQTAEWHI